MTKWLDYGVRRTELRDNILQLWTEHFSTGRHNGNSISKPLSPHLSNRNAISYLAGLSEEILTFFLEKAPAYKHHGYQGLEDLLGGQEMGLAVLLDQKNVMIINPSIYE